MGLDLEDLEDLIDELITERDPGLESWVAEQDDWAPEQHKWLTEQNNRFSEQNEWLAELNNRFVEYNEWLAELMAEEDR